MKYLRTIMSTATLIALSTGAASAISTTTTGANAGPSNTVAATTTATQAKQLTNLQTRGSAQIKLRLATLTKLSGLISGAKHLTASDKSSLSSEVTTEITGLTALETKLNGETTAAGALADVQTIYTEFRVYALVDPKVHLVRTADDQQITEADLSSLATKLQSRLTTEQKAGKDVTSLQTTLTSLQTEITNAQAISTSIEAKVVALQPSDYNTDHTVLAGDAAQLQTAHNDNVVAYNEAKTIVTGIEALK